ncbi:MAG: oligosaccharide flippase family protein [Candidatus Methanofastidiosa archaeon]|nr:oligosaccharide flippase family protein [Candidatus Methanofastidiosa archaeon]
MSSAQKIAKNTGVLLLSRIVCYVLGFIYVIYSARYLGAANFGILSFAIAFTGIFEVFVDLGLNSLATREVARNKSLAIKYINNIIVIKTILSILNFLIIAILVNLLGYPLQTIEVVYLLTLYLILFNFSSMFFSIFQAFEKMEYQSLGQIILASLILPEF